MNRSTPHIALSPRTDRERQLVDEERHRIAGDLHDYPLQNIVVAQMHLDQLAEHVVSSGDHDIGICRDQLRKAAMSLRIAVEALSPKASNGGELRTLIEEFCRDIELDFGIPIVSTIVVDAMMDSTTYDDMFRTACEMVRNAAKHSRASEIRLTIRSTEHSVDVHVSDDGCGFDRAISLLNTPYPETSSGLRMALDRIVRSGGTYALTSAPGQGTRFRCSLPVAAGAGRRVEVV